MIDCWICDRGLTHVGSVCPRRRARGRPPKPPEELLSEVIHVRVTKEELDRLQVRALRIGVSVNVMVRRILRVEAN